MTAQEATDHLLVETYRWYGPKDPVSLEYIRQCGCRGVISALHDIPYGDVWPRESIAERKVIIEAAGLEWLGVESVPVSEEIKGRRGVFEQHIENYKETIRNLAAEGIDLVIYNFMPVLDWVRTDLNYELPDGKRCLLFDPAKFAAFEIHLLGREGAEADYSAKQLEQAEAFFAGLSEEERHTYERGIIDSFPGCKLGLSLDDLRAMITAYADIDAAKLKEHLALFLREVIPVCQEVGVRMAIHPDDPPWSILGLPRIVSTEADLREITEMVDSPANGLCFCTGSLSPRDENDLPGIVERLGHRINYTHLRNTQRISSAKIGEGAFHEADHLDGKVDMYAVIRRLLEECKKRTEDGRADNRLAFRPDHGHVMLDDLNKPLADNPGYTCIGRMRGLAEIRGLQTAITRQIH